MSRIDLVVPVSSIDSVAETLMSLLLTQRETASRGSFSW
jgi:hypothetical protein